MSKASSPNFHDEKGVGMCERVLKLVCHELSQALFDRKPFSLGF